MEINDLITVQVIFSGDADTDNENIERCVSASLIVDVFGRTFDGEYLLENLYELGMDMDEYACIVEENLLTVGYYD